MKNCFEIQNLLLHGSNLRKTIDVCTLQGLLAIAITLLLALQLVINYATTILFSVLTCRLE